MGKAEEVRDMRAGTDRMARLINDLLTLARVESIDSGALRRFDISSAVSDVMSAMGALVAERGLTLYQSIEPGLYAKGDPESVKQVVTILLDNAVKYSDKQGRIDVSLAKSGRRVVFAIRNTGTGISKEDLPRVFDRFFRADPSGTHGSGSYGLGLSNAKAIIDKLGGEIHAESVQGEYATFTFALPL